MDSSSRTPPSRRRFLTTVAHAGIAGTAAVTASFGLSRPAQAHSPDGSDLRVIGPWELSALDPLRSGYMFSRMQVTETLVDYDIAGSPVPGLASAWEVSEDGLRWRFHIRRDVRFHDGTPMTVDDVRRALVGAQRPAGVLSRAPIEAIEANGTTVLIRLSRPFMPLPALLSHSSTQVLAPASFSPSGKVTSIVGTGPFRIRLLEPPQRFSVERVEDWRGPRPAIRSISYLSVGRAEMRALMAESGQADLAYGLDPGSLARLRNNPAVKLHGVPIPRTTMLKVNAGHPWLTDPATRQALSMALDRRGIATAIMRDPSLAASQLFAPTLRGWHQPTLTPLAHDPRAARAIFEGQGWRPGPDGILQRNGERFALTLRTFLDRPELPVISAAIQEQYRVAGIAIRVAVGNSSDVPYGHRDGTLQLALVARNYGVVPDALGTLAQDFSGRGGDWGPMNWSDPGVSDALAALPSAQGNAAALRDQIATTLQSALPLIPVLWYRQSLAASPALSGVSIDPFERSYRLTELRDSRHTA